MVHYIRIAEIKIVEKPDSLKTVVGSCIALCLWDRKQKIGGMAHIMMPKNPGKSSIDAGKYADTAVSLIINYMEKKKSNINDLIAKLIGGASMFQDLDKKSSFNIGNNNYEAVKLQLKKYKIPIKFEEIGGTTGRNVTFDISDGKVNIKTFQSTISG